MKTTWPSCRTTSYSGFLSLPFLVLLKSKEAFLRRLKLLDSFFVLLHIQASQLSDILGYFDCEFHPSFLIQLVHIILSRRLSESQTDHFYTLSPTTSQNLRAFLASFSSMMKPALYLAHIHPLRTPIIDFHLNYILPSRRKPSPSHTTIHPPAPPPQFTKSAFDFSCYPVEDYVTTPTPTPPISISTSISSVKSYTPSLRINKPQNKNLSKRSEAISKRPFHLRIRLNLQDAPCPLRTGTRIGTGTAANAQVLYVSGEMNGMAFRRSIIITAAATKVQLPRRSGPGNATPHGEQNRK